MHRIKAEEVEEAIRKAARESLEYSIKDGGLFAYKYTGAELDVLGRVAEDLGFRRLAKVLNRKSAKMWNKATAMIREGVL